MKPSNALLLSGALLIGEACTNPKGNLDTGPEYSNPSSEGCERAAYIYSYPGTLVEHADTNPLTDVQNTVSVSVKNVGDASCPETELALSHPDGDYFLDVPALAPGESVKVMQKGVVLDRDGDVQFTAHIDGQKIAEKTIDTRQVGSVLVGQMAEYLADEFELDPRECGEDSDNGVPDESSYCSFMQFAAEEGLFTSDYSDGAEYSTLNHGSLATVVVHAFPEYFDALGLPCDLPTDAWYYGDMQAFQTAFPNIDFCDPNAATVIQELYGTTYPNGGVLDQMNY